MTHEELMNELYEVSAFLLKKADLLEKQRKTGLNEDDISIFDILMSVCENRVIHKLYDIESGYINTVDEYHYKIGDGVRARMREEEAE